MKNTIIDQLLAKGIEKERLVIFKGVIRYFRNNEWSSPYTSTQIKEIKNYGENNVVLVEYCATSNGCSRYQSEIFVINKEGYVMLATREVFEGGYWDAPKEWTILSLEEHEDVFIVKGKPFGREVLEKSKKFLSLCPFSEEYEEFFI